MYVIIDLIWAEAKGLALPYELELGFVRLPLVLWLRSCNKPGARSPPVFSHNYGHTFMLVSLAFTRSTAGWTIKRLWQHSFRCVRGAGRQQRCLGSMSPPVCGTPYKFSKIRIPLAILFSSPTLTGLRSLCARGRPRTSVILSFNQQSLI